VIRGARAGRKTAHTTAKPGLQGGLVTKSGWVRGRQAAVGMHLDHLL
jgi:hypothetical protein